MGNLQLAVAWTVSTPVRQWLVGISVGGWGGDWKNATPGNEFQKPRIVDRRICVQELQSVDDVRAVLRESWLDMKMCTSHECASYIPRDKQERTVNEEPKQKTHSPDHVLLTIQSD